MLENCKNARERWGGTHEIIDRWLLGRQQALVAFFAIYDAEGKEDVTTAVEEFNRRLVDYVSEGHFEVYEQLFREAKEFDDGGLVLAKELYPLIDATTQFILDFNDKYATGSMVEANIGSLKGDLSSMGEKMTERFAIEDRLIERLHNAHEHLA
ncbi:sigma D regulator [Reinekea marinisedimentorum]|uniref:Regulator of sigma D n=1 Tax=Reinekea marinisedimentorum TaxID=230495 RepID=A0A4V2UKC6_9GAMM|nr:sigma D regulator [Reinekea marinisedimentorum]TCS43823.1 regulator of sigma D [Reinekea marinisedimentorum]